MLIYLFQINHSNSIVFFFLIKHFYWLWSSGLPISIFLEKEEKIYDKFKTNIKKKKKKKERKHINAIM